VICTKWTFECNCFLSNRVTFLIVFPKIDSMGTSNHEELEEIQNCDKDDIERAEQEQPEGQSSMPSWTSQITIRGLITSFVIGIIYSVIVMKLNLSTGLVPNLNVSAALLGFVLVRTWTMLLEKANVVTTPFTRQENTIIQTCAVACYSTSFGGDNSIILYVYMNE